LFGHKFELSGVLDVGLFPGISLTREKLAK